MADNQIIRKGLTPMKKIALVLMSAIMALSFASCAKKPETKPTEATPVIINDSFTPTRPDEDPVMLGVFDGGLTWELYENGSLYISGEGAMPEWTSVKDSVWRDRINTIKTVYINKGVTTVGSFAFTNAINLTAVYLSDTVTSIGTSAFQRCEKLATVAIPSSVTEFGAAAFGSCFALDSFTIPETVENIGDGCFRGWGEGQKITVKNSESFVTENWSEGWKTDCEAEIIMNA